MRNEMDLLFWCMQIAVMILWTILNMLTGLERVLSLIYLSFNLKQTGLE